MAQITVRLSDELLGEVDRARDLVPRERWVREALKQALGAQTKAPELREPNALSSPTPVRASEPRRESREEAFRRVTQGGG